MRGSEVLAVGGVASQFTVKVATYLELECLPRILRSAREVGLAGFWWSPCQSVPSIGVLCRHLTGNVRQWILYGVCGGSGVRRREEEFLPGGQPEKVIADLVETVGEACRRLLGLTPAVLMQTFVIQGYRVTGLEALFHVTEHFAMHTGQIVQLARCWRGRSMDFYVLRGGVPKPNW